MRTIILALSLLGLLLGCTTPQRAAAESALKAEESYSFLILPCFNPPEEYFVMKRGERYWIGRQGYDGAGGYGYQRNANYAEVEISAAEWQTIREPLLVAGFWTEAVTDCGDFVVLDGDSLRIIGADGKRRKEVFLRDAYYRKDLSQLTAIATKTWQTFAAQRSGESQVPSAAP